MTNIFMMKLEMLAKTDSACEWARDEINKLRAELDEHKAARRAYASEFAPNADGEPDVGSIHQNIRGLKAKFKNMKEAMTYQGAMYQGIAVGDEIRLARNIDSSASFSKGSEGFVVGSEGFVVGITPSAPFPFEVVVQNSATGEIHRALFNFSEIVRSKVTYDP